MSLQFFLLGVFALITACGIYIALQVGWLWGAVAVMVLGVLAIYVIASGASA